MWFLKFIFHVHLNEHSVLVGINFTPWKSNGGRENEFMVAINESCMKSVATRVFFIIYALYICILEIVRILYYSPHVALEVADSSFYT